jgi:hypothetical protein
MGCDDALPEVSPWSSAAEFLEFTVANGDLVPDDEVKESLAGTCTRLSQ